MTYHSRPSGHGHHVEHSEQTGDIWHVTCCCGAEFTDPDEQAVKAAWNRHRRPRR